MSEESLILRLQGVADILAGREWPFVKKCRELFQEAANRISELEEKGEGDAT